MHTPSRLRSPRARHAAAVALAACVPLAASAGLASARIKSCTRISNCATVVKAVPPPQSTLAGPPPVGHVGVTVRTAPTATLNARRQAGKLIVGSQPAQRISCRGYKPRDPTPVLFQLKTATAVNITYAITNRITNTTADGVQFCLAANFPFRTASGGQAPAARLPDGTRGHIGLLPPCAKPLLPAGAATAPCVESISTVPDANSSTKVDVIVKARVPTRTKGDPWGSS